LSQRILVISQLPPPYHGSTVMTAALMSVLSAAGADVHVVERRFSRTVAEIGGLSFRKLMEVPALCWRLIVATRVRPDVVVFFCTNRPFSFLVDVLLASVLRARGVVVVNYVHTSGYRELASRGRLWRTLVGYLLSTAKLSVALSATLADDLLDFVPSGSVRVVPNAVLDAPQTSAIRKDLTQVLFLSNLIEEKGVDVFVEVAIRSCIKDPDTTFVLIGSTVNQGLEEDLKQRVSAAGFADRIRFVGTKTGADKWELLGSSSVLVFPSRYKYEAQPLSILEALSSGLPVISSPAGAIRDIVVDGENGFLLQGDLVAATEAALDRLHRERALLPSMSSAARLAYETLYSKDQYQVSWCRVLRELGGEVK
jgi:glycosyltransferase involved in cell wall biosynthesis